MPTPGPLVLPAPRGSRSSSGSASIHDYPLAPKTPVTVTSSYDDHWGGAVKVLKSADEKAAEKPASNGEKEEKGALAVSHEVIGASGAGLTTRGQLGLKVDIKGLKGRRRRGVGPGVT